jgi:putative ABC transport system ATP-binding protein
MESFFKYIWRHSWRAQFWILAVVLLSMPVQFALLDLPKLIINGPIQGRGFATPEIRQTSLAIHLPVPDFIAEDGWIELFEGFDLNRLQTLFALSAVFLSLVILSGAIKYYLNTFKGRLGERMLRRLRYELVDRVLRFPPDRFRQLKPSEVATMVKDEVEPLGGFTGDAFAQPLILGGQIIIAMTFILLQSVPLGLVSLAFLLVQAVVIPKLRRRQLELGRERQLTARALAGRIGEIVEQLPAIRAHGVANHERADIASRLGRIFAIRFELYQRKFFVKFLNNFLSQLTPFVFYSLGGYLAITGHLDIGQLVAVIAAYRELPTPTKELIDWDLQRQDAQIKYEQVLLQFPPDGLVDIDGEAGTTPQRPAAGEPALALESLAVADETGRRIVEDVSLGIAAGETLAVVSLHEGGADSLLAAVAGLAASAAGNIVLAGTSVSAMSGPARARFVSYVGAETAFGQTSIGDALLHGLKRQPRFLQPQLARHRWRVREARAAGNPFFDPDDDWIDYRAIGERGPTGLDQEMRRILRLVELEDDVIGFGLRSRLPANVDGRLAAGLIIARTELRRRLEREGIGRLVDFFNVNRYSRQSTIAENILFGASVAPELAVEALPYLPWFRAVLRDSGLEARLIQLGQDLAVRALDLVAGLSPADPVHERLGLFGTGGTEELTDLLRRRPGARREALRDSDDRLLALALQYVEPRHRMGLLVPDLQADILAARLRFARGLPESLSGRIDFYNAGSIIGSGSVEDNVLFGRVAGWVAQSRERVADATRKVIMELGLEHEIIRLGIGHDMGVAGRRLSPVQRQKLALARALIRRPALLLLDRALSQLDRPSLNRLVAAVLAEARTGPGAPMAVVWNLSGPAMAAAFDRVAVFEDSRMIDEGPHDAVMARCPAFQQIAEKPMM